MKHDEYHRQFADRVIEQIRQGTAPGRIVHPVPPLPVPERTFGPRR